MLASYKLPLHFDAARLREDLERVLARERWLPLFEWEAISLRSVAGDVSKRALRQKAGAYADTEVLAECPYFQEVLDVFRCPKHRVRLFRLPPGGVVREHIDSTDMTYRFGTARIHIPVLTGPEVETFVDGERIVMREGEAWYIDTSYFPHGVANRGATDRVHLVVDCEINDWVRRQIPTRFAEPPWLRPLAYRFRRLRFRIKTAALLLLLSAYPDSVSLHFRPGSAAAPRNPLRDPRRGWLGRLRGLWVFTDDPNY